MYETNIANSFVFACLTSAAAAAAKSLQSCPTLWGPIDGRPPGSPVPGILQARTLEWVAISFSNAWKWKVKVKSLSRVRLLVTPWTAAYQAPPSMGFSRQEYWSGVPLPSPKESLVINKCISVLKEWKQAYLIYLISLILKTVSNFIKSWFEILWPPSTFILKYLQYQILICNFIVISCLY